MAGREGFEPPEVLPSTVFKTAAFNHSAISRIYSIYLFIFGGDTQIRTGDQGFAGPRLTTWLCRHKNLWCPKPDLNRHGSNIRGILSPLCLPIPPPGQHLFFFIWSGKRGSNPRPQPWQGCALPLSYSRIKIRK